MDLATKSKNINPFVKIIVVILSIATMFGAFQCGVKVLNFADVYGDVIFDVYKGVYEDSSIDASSDKKVSVFDSTSVHSATFDIVDAVEFLSVRGAKELTEAEINKVEKAYYKSNEDYYCDNTLYDVLYASALKFYVVNTKTNVVLTNFDNPNSYKTLYNDHNYAFSSVKGVGKHSMDLNEMYNFELDKSINAYFYFDVDADGYYNGGTTIEDRVATNINLANKLSTTNVKFNTILAVILALISIALAICSFVICGKRMENGKVKPSFIDYIPLDLHFAVSVGLSTLLVLAMIYALEESGISQYRGYQSLEYRDWWMLAISACAAGVQLLVIEFVTSFIRICKGNRRWYKTTLFTLLSYLLIKLGVKLHKFNKVHRAKRHERFKEIFGYKLGAFKKRLVLFLVGYGLLNLFLFVMGIIWYGVAQWSEMGTFWGIVDILCIIALNIATLIFVVRYVNNLDKIIVASHNRTVPDVDYDKLPQSLKMLVDSIQYTSSELQTAVEKAVKDERMRTELITNVSHDLKTPLTAIINYVDLLKGCDIQDETAREYISILDEKGVTLKRLIEDLLEASKVTSGVITLNPINLDLSELATQAIVEHQQEFVDNFLELVFKGDKQSVFAFVDGNKTYRVIENLLSNAKKYSAKGSRVYADVFEENGMSVFEIKNISAEALDISADELKERFVRGDKSRTNEGNGLGLSIADNLCKAMGGRLDIIIDGDLFKARVILPKNK